MTPGKKYVLTHLILGLYFLNKFPCFTGHVSISCLTWFFFYKLIPTFSGLSLLSIHLCNLHFITLSLSILLLFPHTFIISINISVGQILISMWLQKIQETVSIKINRSMNGTIKEKSKSSWESCE